MYINIYFQNFFENLLIFLLIPTTLLIPAIIILGIYGKINKNYTRLSRFLKWWTISLVPVFIVYLLWIITRYYFYKEIGI